MSSKKTAKKPQTKHANVSKPVDTKFASYGLLGALAVLMYYYCRSFNFIQDDSFITFRYVKNFIEGNGLVFNIAERVEGYTCFLWVMLLSGAGKIGFDYVSASQTIGIIFSALTLLFTYLISSRIFPKGKDPFYNLVFSLIAVVLIAANGSFAYWTVSGMETAMFGFLVTLAVYLYLKELKQNSSSIPISSVVFLLASMTRPEGNLIFAITLIHKIVITYKKSPPEGSTKAQLLFSRNNIYWLAIYLVPALIFMIWRYSYYGYLLPNTFYAKTGSSAEYFKAGFEYFWEFTKSYGGYGILTAMTLLTLRNKERYYDYLYLVLIFFVFSAYVIFVGGDVLRPNRFFVPLMPVFFILVQESLSELLSKFDKKKSFTAGALIGIVFAIGFSYYIYKNEFEQIKKYSELEKGLVEKMKITGTWLKAKQQQAGRPLVVGASTIGAVSYYSEVVLIDMLGLTDKEIAHNPKPIPEISSKEVGWRERNYNVDYVLSRKPDLIYFSTGIKPSAYAERGLFTSDEFMKYYYPYYFTVKDQNFTDVMYKRKPDEDVKNSPVLQPNPNYKKSFVNTYNQAMNTLRDRTKTQDAINLYKQALAEGPSGWGTPYQMIGDVYIQLKDNNRALENYSKAVETDDYNVLAHYYLYQASIGKKDSVSAKIHYDKLVKYAPDMIQ
jgi:arabinofuranosyltransferase